MERQYLDINAESGESLRVNETPVDAYFRNFQWDYAKYQHQGRQLVDIVGQIQGLAAKIEDELKKLAALYNEKSTLLSSLQRKKTINLATSDFEDFLAPEVVAKLEILKSGSLLTVFVVVPKAYDAGMCI